MSSGHACRRRTLISAVRNCPRFSMPTYLPNRQGEQPVRDAGAILSACDDIPSQTSSSLAENATTGATGVHRGFEVKYCDNWWELYLGTQQQDDVRINGVWYHNHFRHPNAPPIAKCKYHEDFRPVFVILLPRSRPPGRKAFCSMEHRVLPGVSRLLYRSVYWQTRILGAELRLGQSLPKAGKRRCVSYSRERGLQ